MGYFGIETSCPYAQPFIDHKEDSLLSREVKEKKWDLLLTLGGHGGFQPCYKCAVTTEDFWLSAEKTESRHERFVAQKGDGFL